ncbi:alpha/beta fold hydrolase [Zhengella sp. ZM62]|uniref:alpha/beta fold hydrolase n=1 Tax=Zhengella sedimenti TaxID=3390035 RepID=UPI003976DD2F
MPATPPALVISRRDGPRTVLLHGMVMAPSFWQTYAPPVCRTGTAIAYPLPGHFPWTLGAGARALCMDAILDAYADAIVRDFKGRPVTLVGHSTGAFMALGLAARHPALVEGLVIMGALSCGGLDGCQPFAMRLLRLRGFGQWGFERLLSLWISTPARFIEGARTCVAQGETPRGRRDVEAIERVRQSLLRSNPAEIAALVRLLSRTSLSDVLPAITCPALNIVGGMDRVIRPRHQFGIQAAMPAVTTLFLPSAGHLPMVEKPGEVAVAVHAFMRMHGLLQTGGPTAPANNLEGAHPAYERPRGVAAPGSGEIAMPAG